MTTSHPSVFMIDCHYVEPEKAAAFLIVEGDRALFVDNNTYHAIPRLMKALDAVGLRPDQVDYAIVTHIHLDHSGGTAELLRHCPRATVLAHPKAARHLMDPSRLVAGAKTIYGEEAFEGLYGTIESVPEDRIRIMEDGEELTWGSRSLRFIYTKGHASHHFCIHDSGSDGIFAGDAFGLGRMTASRPGPAFTVCSSSPPEFDPEEARLSVQKILDTGASRAFITHYGYFDDLGQRAEQLRHSIDQLEEIGQAAIESGLEGDALVDFCRVRVDEAFRKHLVACGVDDPEGDRQWLEGDLYLNSLGLRFYVERMRKAG